MLGLIFCEQWGLVKMLNGVSSQVIQAQRVLAGPSAHACYLDTGLPFLLANPNFPNNRAT
jgi:hypothetical protein